MVRRPGWSAPDSTRAPQLGTGTGNAAALSFQTSTAGTNAIPAPVGHLTAVCISMASLTVFDEHNVRGKADALKASDARVALITCPRRGLRMSTNRCPTWVFRRSKWVGDADDATGPRRHALAMTQTCFPTALTPLVDALDLAVRPRRPAQPTVDAVAAALAPFLGRPDLLAPDQRIGDPAGYRQHLLHVPDDGAYSLVALVWLPGQSTAVHDHIAWCVVGVHEGAEREIRYRAVGEHLVEIDRVVSPQGSVAGLVPPGDIHRVANDSDRAAVSLHVYGADLRQRGTSIRRRYELPILDARAA